MLNDITKITLEYLNNHQAIDRKYIKNVFKIIKCYYSLNDLKLVFNSNLDNDLAIYAIFTNTIYVNEVNLFNFNNSILNEYNFNSLEKELLPFFIFLRALFHEIDHALRYHNLKNNSQDNISFIAKYTESYIVPFLQEKNIKKKVNDLKNKYGDEVDNFFEFKQEQYNTYLLINPLERYAETQAFDFILTIIYDLKLNLPKLIAYFKKQKYYQLLYANIIFENPLKTYLENIKYNQTWPIKEGLEYENAWEEVKKLENLFNFHDAFILGYPSLDDYIEQINNKVATLELTLKKQV